MTTKIFLTIGSMAAAVLLPVGTGRAAEPFRGAAEPRELLERQAKAVVAGDQALYLSTFSMETPHAKEYLAVRAAAFDAVVTAKTFYEKLTKAYGPAGAAKIGLPPGLADMGGIPDPAGIEAHASNTKFKMEGNTAITVGWGGTPAGEQKLIQQNGKWLADPADANPTSNTADQLQMLPMLIGMLKGMTQPMQEVMPLIGRPGQTPETIQAAAEKKAQILMGAGGPAQPRVTEETGVTRFAIPTPPDDQAAEQAAQHGEVTPLHKALNVDFSGKADAAEVRRLIAAGADVNAKDPSGKTPLFLAAAIGDVELLQLLLDHGATVDNRNRRFETALFIAAKNGHAPAVDLLLKHGADAKIVMPMGGSIVCAAVDSGNIAIVEKILAAGATIAATKQAGWPALICAVAGKVEMLEYLVGKGANVNDPDLSGSTALARAADGNHTAVAKWLLDHGAKVEPTDISGATALHRAHGAAIAKLLIEHGAQVNVRSRKSAPSLSSRSDGKVTTTVEIDNYTPLHIATAHAAISCASGRADATDQTEVIAVLLNHGAEVNAADGNGLTALAIAQKFDCQAIIDLLKQHGAK